MSNILALPVLFEHHKNTALLTGFTDNYIKIELPYQTDKLNTIAPIFLEKINADGDVVSQEVMELV
jgi:threonylcarbamoyladenosine tRNA methylthiotransferase MtaB